MSTKTLIVTPSCSLLAFSLKAEYIHTAVVPASGMVLNLQIQF